MSFENILYTSTVTKGSAGFRALVRDILHEKFSETLQPYYEGRSEIYYMESPSHNYTVGRSNRHMTYLNTRHAVDTSVVTEQRTEVIAYADGLERPLTLHQPSDNAQVIVHNGIALASFAGNQLDIHFNPFDTEGLEDTQHLESMKALFEIILAQYKELFLKRLDEQYSWKNEATQATLKATIMEQSVRMYKREKDDLMQKERTYEQRIQEKQREIKQTYDNLLITRKKLTAFEDGGAQVADKVVEQLSLLANHPKISDVQIREGKIKIYVPNVIAVDKKDRYFRIGNMTATLDMATSTVIFDGDTKRRSHWTQKDPHPHVNGRDGSACLGNTSSTIAELSAQNELYALAMVVIDFMENANIDDTAGRNVVNWDRVNPDGTKYIETLEDLKAKAHDHVSYGTCSRCEEEDEHLFQVYDGYEITEGRILGTYGRLVCEDCRDSYYAYWESAGIYVETDHDEADANNELETTQA